MNKQSVARECVYSDFSGLSKDGRLMSYRAIMQDGEARGICRNVLSRMEDAVPALKRAKEQWAAKVLLQQVLRNSISWS